MYMHLIKTNHSCWLFEEIMCTCIKLPEFTTKICMKENNIDSIQAGIEADFISKQNNIVGRQNDEGYANDCKKC